MIVQQLKGEGEKRWRGRVSKQHTRTHHQEIEAPHGAGVGQGDWVRFVCVHRQPATPRAAPSSSERTRKRSSGGNPPSPAGSCVAPRSPRDAGQVRGSPSHQRKESTTKNLTHTCTYAHTHCRHTRRRGGIVPRSLAALFLIGVALTLTVEGRSERKWGKWGPERPPVTHYNGRKERKRE